MFIYQNVNKPFSIGYRIAKHIITAHVVQGKKKGGVRSKSSIKFINTCLHLCDNLSVINVSYIQAHNKYQCIPLYDVHVWGILESVL
jgi:hypothetical protein